MDKKEPASSTPKVNAQFGVLDLLLLTLSIAYVCGLVILGQKTTFGEVLLDGTARFVPSLAAFGLISYLVSFLGSIFFLVIVIDSPHLAPRLLLVMNLVTVLACQVFQFLPQREYEDMVLSGVVSYGALLFLPAWLVNNLVLGRKLTETHWLMLFFATFCNVCLIAFIGLKWALMGS
ncbi:hypothetical protein Pan97_02890 [Bremerella volcania]|uniref:Yip1 domain protein n=1 Tax=Bremerella volcania TaxID=2527984 RepID=A0A518C267_9BACT|nr:hypothetical protein [Bremerella volcania]QDU73320.1 hypothetical protein Pan97_02890 [Bremerella volcania]